MGLSEGAASRLPAAVGRSGVSRVRKFVDHVLFLIFLLFPKRGAFSLGMQILRNARHTRPGPEQRAEVRWYVLGLLGCCKGRGQIPRDWCRSTTTLVIENWARMNALQEFFGLFDSTATLIQTMEEAEAEAVNQGLAK
ncbi:hypothetical protein F5Y16DRAFT_263391 [Xylariaceae sp. FL0255]|nr:hypothetical protein F5Y16DRAFT_263391 [Xylariaceae sp. FL0255]